MVNGVVEEGIEPSACYQKSALHRSFSIDRRKSSELDDI
jgi:hypothetical protein